MRILFLTSDLDVTNGWGRYSAGFLAQARKRFGEANVDAPEPRGLASAADGKLKLPLTILDALRLRRTAMKADVIHAATERVAPLARLLSFWTGKPFVISAHGTYADAAAYPWYLKPMYRASFRSAAVVAAVSRYTARVVTRSFAPRRVEIVPGGFDAPAVPAVERRLSSERRILSVGACKPRKGFHALIEALGLLKKEGFACRADIVGPKEPSKYVERLEARLKGLGLEEQVSLRGRVPEEALARFYEEADLFVLPSEHDGAAFEGLGLVYLEAMSYGLPVIGCLESGAEDVIQDGVNGRLVPPGDPGRLAAAIRSILGDQDAWKRMSDIAPGSIARFRWERVGAEMEEVYKKAIAAYAR